MATEENIFLQVRQAYPEGAPCKPGTDRDWIYNVWGTTEEANPLNEGLGDPLVAGDLEAPMMEPVQPAAPEPWAEPEQANPMIKAALGSIKPSGSMVVAQPMQNDDFGLQPISW